MKSKYSLAALAISVIMLTACSHEKFTYLPEINLSNEQTDPRGASYPIWSGAFEGNVQVSFVGLKELSLRKSETPVRCLQIRMKLKNEQLDENWVLDAREIYLDLPGFGKNRAVYINSKEPGVPEIVVKPQDEETINLYFSVPTEIKSEKKLTQFSLDWVLQTAERKVAKETQFERATIEHYGPAPNPYFPYHYPYNYSFGTTWGMGPYWWYDSAWTPWVYRVPPRILNAPSGVRNPSPPVRK